MRLLNLHKTRSSMNRQAFTLLELMVVVAIIALLIAVLLPSLQSARAHSRTVFCGTNLKHVGVAMANYLYSSKSTYPASYVYPDTDEGSWSVKNQVNGPQHGYLHWSYFMYEGGQVPETAFQCPNFENGGAPRTNPGKNTKNWEAQQTDQNASSIASATSVEDKQAARLSYATNATIVPRNKLVPGMAEGQRLNVFVKEQTVRKPGGVILATEYLNNWKALGLQSTDQGGAVLSKSHRPINPFFHVGAGSSGYNEYTPGVNSPGFLYGPNDEVTYGLFETIHVRSKTNILDHTSGIGQINAIGRHHPTADSIYAKKYGGSANFSFLDGHVENLKILETMEKRMWGDRYYGLTGANEVLNMSRLQNTGD